MLRVFELQSSRKYAIAQSGSFLSSQLCQSVRGNHITLKAVKHGKRGIERQCGSVRRRFTSGTRGKTISVKDHDASYIQDSRRTALQRSKNAGAGSSKESKNALKHKDMNQTGAISGQPDSKLDPQELETVLDILRPAPEISKPKKYYDWNSHSKLQRHDIRGHKASFASIIFDRNRWRSFWMVRGFRAYEKRNKLKWQKSIEHQKQVLIYDYRQGERELVTPSSRILISINHKDLFTIINSGLYPPAFTLNAVNTIEAEGWELVGDMHGEPNKLVFQQINHLGPFHKFRSPSILRMLILSVLTAGGAAIVYCGVYF